MKVILILILTKLVFATNYICKGDDTLATIVTKGDYQIKININGTKYDGIWKGSTVDENDKPIKLHYLYSDKNIWLHSKNQFSETTIRFNSDLDNMYLKNIKCKSSR